MAKQRYYGEGNISILPDKMEDWVEMPLEPLRGFEASFDGYLSLDALLWLLGIPGWSIDAELVYMNWR